MSKNNFKRGALVTTGQYYCYLLNEGNSKPPKYKFTIYNHSLPIPIMVIEEIKRNINHDTGEYEIQQVKCRWFSIKSMKFHERWFSCDTLDILNKGRLEHTINTRLSSNNTSTPSTDSKSTEVASETKEDGQHMEKSTSDAEVTEPNTEVNNENQSSTNENQEESTIAKTDDTLDIPFGEDTDTPSIKNTQAVNNTLPNQNILREALEKIIIDLSGEYTPRLNDMVTLKTYILEKLRHIKESNLNNKFGYKPPVMQILEIGTLIPDSGTVEKLSPSQKGMVRCLWYNPNEDKYDDNLWLHPSVLINYDDIK